jgi:hypothetical protein
MVAAEVEMVPRQATANAMAAMVRKTGLPWLGAYAT